MKRGYKSPLDIPQCFPPNPNDWLAYMEQATLIGCEKMISERFSGKKPSPGASAFMAPLWLKKAWENQGSEMAQSVSVNSASLMTWLHCREPKQKANVRDTPVILVFLCKT